MSVSAVLFDLGNVVCDWQPIHLYNQVFDDPDEARRFVDEVCTLEWHTAHDRGVPMDDNIAALITQHPHYAEQIRLWKTRWLDMFTGYVRGTPEIIADLQARDIPLFALSNLPAEIFHETREAFPVLKVFRDTIVSGEEGVVKPDPAIYHIALARMGLPATEVFFIDDRADNTAAAEALGFHTHTFTGADRLRSHLTQIGLLA